MISCREYQEILGAEVGKEIPESVAIRLAAHWEQCPQCLVESESFEPLIKEIRDLPLADPGELFFRRQLKTIESQIKAEESSIKRRPYRPWYASLVAAAALLLIFIGYGRFGSQGDEAWRKDWKSALTFLADDPDPELIPLELEELNAPELDRVAQGLLQNISKDPEGLFPVRSDDWMDLNGDEMDDLLRRLQAEEGRKAS